MELKYLLILTLMQIQYQYLIDFRCITITKQSYVYQKTRLINPCDGKSNYFARCFVKRLQCHPLDDASTASPMSGIFNFYN